MSTPGCCGNPLRNWGETGITLKHWIITYVLCIYFQTQRSCLAFHCNRLNYLTSAAKLSNTRRYFSGTGPGSGDTKQVKHDQSVSMRSSSLRGCRHRGDGGGKSSSLGANVCPRKVSSWPLLVIGRFCRSSTRQGEGLRLRSSIETTPNCSTMNKLPNTEKSKLKKKSVSFNHVPCKAEEKIKSELHTMLSLFSLKGTSASLLP